MTSAGDITPMNTPAKAAVADDRPISVQVNFFGRPRSKAVARFASARIRRALNRFQGMVSAAKVRIRDVNADRGGEDQQCSLELHLANGAHLHLSEVAPTPMQALRRIARRTKHVLQRRNRKRHQRTR